MIWEGANNNKCNLIWEGANKLRYRIFTKIAPGGNFFRSTSRGDILGGEAILEGGAIFSIPGIFLTKILTLKLNKTWFKVQDA